MPLPVMPVTPLAQNPAELCTQTFDVSTVAENSAMGAVADQPYRIYLPDGTLRQQGMLTDGATLTVSTAEPAKVRCEIGAGDWGGRRRLRSSRTSKCTKGRPEARLLFKVTCKR